MLEFGSDFHSFDNYFSKRAHLTNIYPNAIYLANGRLCLIALIKQNSWQRVWLPEYFCREVAESVASFTGIEMKFYKDYPSNDDRGMVMTLPYREGDVLLRVNFFGMRDFRSEVDIPIPVIEDHTHDLLSHWALYSDADWCIASLRKTLPIPEGGMLWSPKGHVLPDGISCTEENAANASKRWGAMDMKKDYLEGKLVSKEEFRAQYIDSDESLGKMVMSAIDERSMAFIQQLDINKWYNAKKYNLKRLTRKVNTTAPLIVTEDESCNAFSFVVLADSREQRDQYKQELVKRMVYPAILWSLPDNVGKTASAISERMLSIHCDGRYSIDDMDVLSEKINEVLML